MKKNRLTEAQIIEILKDTASGMTASDICRKHRISMYTYHEWKRLYGNMELSESKRRLAFIFDSIESHLLLFSFLAAAFLYFLYLEFSERLFTISFLSFGIWIISFLLLRAIFSKKIRLSGRDRLWPSEPKSFLAIFGLHLLVLVILIIELIRLLFFDTSNF